MSSSITELNDDPINGEELVINDAINYLKNHTFVPHKMGNYGRYGLNMFGGDSIIQYNNQLWKFIWLISNSNNAVYVNKNGEKYILEDYDKNITRMQEDNAI